MKDKSNKSHNSKKPKQSEDARWATRLVRERMKESQAITHFGFDVEKVEKGRAIFLLDVLAHHKQLHGVVHGGILAALADTTAAIAAYTTVPNGTEIATVELKINYLEPVPGGRIKADARVLRTGRNFVVAECEIINEDGSLAAKALLTFGATAGYVISR
ncbi:MAG TPA: PaaI family thioesterase [Candidatus Acidoferrum sp.]|nr:PaaI family thioesterase [Candidatus Acidoferrum sp.]